MKKVFFTILSIAYSLGLYAIGNPSDFKTIKSASELKAMSSTGLTNVQPTQAQIVGFTKVNSTNVFRYSNIYTQSASTTSPYQSAILNTEVINDGVRELNIARYIAGVSSNIESTDECNDMASKAALICAVNKSISHDPYKPQGMDDALYKDAHNACTGSNLAYGYKNIADNILNGWLQDSGEQNLPSVGHRLWCLTPNLYRVGFGMAKNGSTNYDAMFYQTRKYAKYENIITVAWPAVNMPVDEISAGSPFSFFIHSDDYKVQFGNEVSIYMVRKKDNRLFKYQIKGDKVTNSDGRAFVYNGLADCKAVIWCPEGYTNYSFSHGEEYDVYIAGFYVDGKPYPIKYTIHFFDTSKVSANNNTQSGSAVYASTPIRQTSSVPGWTQADLSTYYKSHTWDFSDVIVKEGNYTIRFNYSRGSALKCKNVVIKADGLTIASFSQEISAGTSPKSFEYTFNVKSTPQKIIFTADICAEGNSYSEGYIDIRRNSSATADSPSLKGGDVKESSSSTSSSQLSVQQGTVVDKWTAGNIPTSFRSLSWDFSKYINNVGEYSIIFTYTSGACRFLSKNAKIQADGVTIATFPNQVTADKKSLSFNYTFNLKSKPKKLLLVADVCTAGGIMSNGEISILYNGKSLSSSAAASSTSSSAATTSTSNTSTIAGWKRGEIGTSYQAKTWNLTNYISKPGNYTITFTYKDGGCMLKSKNAIVSANMKTIAKFPDEVSAGNNPRSFTYTFNVSSQPSTLLLTADVCTVGGINSNGDITIVRNGDVSTISNITSSSADIAPSNITSSNKWSAGEFTTTYQQKTWDLTKYITKSGNYSVTFKYTSGGNMFVSKNATIQVDGVTIATFPDEVSAGFSPRSWTYTFNIKSTPKKVLLIADFRTDGGNKSNGDITVVRNGYATSAAPTLNGGYNGRGTSIIASSSLSTPTYAAATISPAANTPSSTSGNVQIERKSAPIDVPKELIIYNKGAQNVATTVETEVIPFNTTPKIVEYTTGRIKRPDEYLQRYSYPTNTAAQTVNASATRGDRIEKGVLYIAEGVSTIYKNAYKGRTDINKVILPASVKVIGDYAFADMPNLQTVESKVRNSYQSVRYIGDHAFDNDTRLTTFPELSDLEYLGVCAFRKVGLEKTRVQAYFVADSAFWGSALKSVGWSSIIAIGDYAFKDCKQLSEWNFVENPYIEYIGHGAFLGTSLKNVDLREGINVGLQAFEPNTMITWRVSNNRAPKQNDIIPVPKMTRENYKKVMSETNDFSIYMPEGYDPVKSVDVPLVLYLHGRSMCQDLPPAPEYGPAIAMMNGYRIFHNKPVLLVCPSAISKEGWSSIKLHNLYEFLKAHYAFDHKQFYVVGLSMGGWGTLNYVNRYPNEVAACVAICGGCDATNPCGLNSVPTWIIHAIDDEETSVECSDRVVNAMKKCGNTQLLQYSRLEEGGHSLIHFFTYSSMFDWLFSHKSDVRKFNRNIDFVNNPEFDIDEAHWGLGGDYDYFISQDTDITSTQLAKIKQRKVNAQGTKYNTVAAENNSKNNTPTTIVPITRIKVDY